MSEQPGTARPIRRRVITEEVHEGPVRAHALVCEAASCVSAQSHDITLRLGEASAEAGLTDVVIKRRRPAAIPPTVINVLRKVQAVVRHAHFAGVMAEQVDNDRFDP